MKKVNEFLNSFYFGDRYCEKLESHNGIIIIQVNCISRIEKGSTEWNFYSAEDIEHGNIIFEEVTDVVFSNDLELNDEIYEIVALEKINDRYLFLVQGCNVDESGNSKEIEIRFMAKDVYLLDPVSGEKIVE